MREDIALNFDWLYKPNFRPGDESVHADESDFITVNIPHTNIELPLNNFDEKTYQFVSCYRKHWVCDEKYRGKRLVLRFEGVSLSAEITVNGRKAGVHRGGFTPFETDITELVRLGEDNIITVKNDARELSDIPPCGGVCDYLTYGGIYREVSVLVREPVYVKDVFVRCEDCSNPIKTVRAEVCLSEEADADLVCRVRDGARILAEGRAEARDGRAVLCVQAALDLWDLDSPRLYTFETELAGDMSSVSFGAREAVFKPDGFYLNGRKLKLAGLNRHQSYPYVGFAMPASAQKRDAHMLKFELGLNLVRTSHYPQSRHFIAECDRIGLLVFEELPGWQHIGEGVWREILLNNLREMILRDRNSPSVILWGVRVNESPDCDELYKETNAAARRLDPTRQTGGVRCFKNSSLLEDVYTYNDFSYNGWNAPLIPAEEATDTGAPYMVTEYGGHMFPTKSFDPEAKRLEHALRHARVLGAMYESPRVSGAIGWCMSDYNTHREFGSGDKVCYHGVTDMFRVPKLAYYAYLDKKAPPAMAVSSGFHIGDHNRSVIDRVFVFTNCEKLRLYRNGRLIAEYEPDYAACPGAKESGYLPPYDVSDLFGNLLETDEGLAPEQARLVKEMDYRYLFRGKDVPDGLLAEAQDAGVTPEKATALYNKYIANWGGKRIDYTFEGLRGGKPVCSWSSATGEPELTVEADSNRLTVGETYDVTRVVISLKNGSDLLRYAFDALTLETEGPISVIGDRTVSLVGGTRGLWIKTGKETGKARLIVRSGRFGVKMVDFTVEAAKEQRRAEL